MGGQGRFLSLVSDFYDVNIVVIPLLYMVSYGSKPFHFSIFVAIFWVIFDSIDPRCFGEFWSTNLVARTSLIMWFHS